MYLHDRLHCQGLDREKVGIILELCERGVNPDALAQVIKYLRRENMADISAQSEAK